MSRTVIVFLEDCLLAVAGKEGKYPSLERVERVKLLAQGDSFERWQEALTGLSAEWKTEKVQLVLPANMCSARVLKLPYGKGRQLADMALKEVEDSFRNEVADYCVIRADKKDGVEICAGGADTGEIDRFEEICREAGFSIEGMTVPMEGYIHTLQGLDSYWKDTAIYLFFDEGSMISVLCERGHYLYSGRSRIFSEPGTLDFGTEIVRSISGILQFCASEKRDIPITDVYYAGCPEEDFEVSVEGLEAMRLRARPMELDQRISLPGREKAGDWISCIGAMICGGKREKQINLYKENKKNAEGQKATGLWKHFIMPVATFVLCIIPAIIVAFMNLKVSSDIVQKQGWIGSTEVQGQYRRALTLERKLAEINGSIEAVRRTGQNLSTYPEVTADVLHRIENAGGAGIECRITGYDASTGVLTFEALSREVIDGPAYILKLQDSGLFHSVDYMGYAFDNDWYTLALSGTLEGKSVQEGETE